MWLSACLETHVEAFDAVGECSDGHVVDALEGVVAYGVDGDAA